MVLQSNYAKRYVSNAENTPPSPVKPKNSRLPSTIQDAARRRRARTNGAAKGSKYTVEQAKRRSQSKPAGLIKFKVAAAPVVRDVEMKDATPSFAPKVVTLPKHLGRPQYCDISKDALAAIDPDLADADLEFIREGLEQCGPDMFRALTGVKASPAKDVVPRELDITIQDASALPPSHMLAVHGPKPPSAPRTKVTLYPVHSIFLSSYCAKLPAFPATESAPSTSGSHTHTIPVRPLCLPSPSTYVHLAAFLYTKRSDMLFTSLMPPNTKPSSSLLSSLSSPSNDDVTAYATAMAGTYTTAVLLQHAFVVHGLWRNVCALGIFDDALWDVIDAAWKVLLTAIAVSTGTLDSLMEQEQDSD